MERSDYFVKLDSDKSDVLDALSDWDDKPLNGESSELPLCHGERIAVSKREGFPLFRHDIDGIMGGYVIVGPLSRRRADALAVKVNGKVLTSTRGIRPPAIGFHTDG